MPAPRLRSFAAAGALVLAACADPQGAPTADAEGAAAAAPSASTAQASDVADDVADGQLPLPQRQWWQRLQALCGQAFEGHLQRAPQGDDTFRNAPVVMHVRDCSAQRVRIPLVIGDDRSRVWVFSHDDGRLQFRHEHRRADGSLESVHDYGGFAANSGSADTQMFPADDITVAAIPGSGQRSVWLVEIHPDKVFTYAANRVGTERGFQVDFDLGKPVAAPPAPWGWED